MKKLLSKFSFLLFVLLLISCSGGGDDDSVDSPSDYIDLYLSDTELFIGQSVVLSAFSSSGQNITSATEFYINSNKYLQIPIILRRLAVMMYLLNIMV